MGFFNSESEKKFKTISLRTYSVKDVLHNNERLYSKVFETSSVDYLYFDLLIHNYFYEEEDWDGEIKFIVTKGSLKEKTDEFTKEFVVPKEKSTLHIRTGYGKDKPGYWTAGIYEVIALFDGEIIGGTSFSFFDKGLPTKNDNPYFEFSSFKLFYNPVGESEEAMKMYYSSFEEEKLFYLGIEFELTPHFKQGHCPSNLSILINNKNGLQKAVLEQEAMFFDTERGPITYTLNWGSEAGDFWRKGIYEVYIHFMNTLIGVTEFSVGDKEVLFKGVNMLNEYTPSLNLHAFSSPTQKQNQNAELSYNEVKKELFELIGLQNVKEEIEELATFLNYLKIRRIKGIKDKVINSDHIIFTGNPGTGKTTVAKLLGKIYKSLGILSQGHLVEVGRAELVAEFVGQTAPKVKKVIEKARGGLLFIDEAYALARKDESAKDFGKEAIEVLMKEMSDGPGDLVMIFAGYPEEMNDFILSNPGIKSRISQTIHFEDYTPKELFDIGLFMAKRKNVELDDEAKVFLQEELYEIYRSRDNNFGNARLMESIIQEAKMELAKRIMKEINPDEMDLQQLSTIRLVDIKPVFEEHDAIKINIPIDAELLEEGLSELDQMVGMDLIKEEIHEVVKLVKYYRKIEKDFRRDFSLHQIFTGNPGTGKTTMARILVKIYKALGILEKGHLVEVDRTELVGEYSGQTAPKTNNVINRAMGGMLFIDEAYSLVLHNDSFGNEAIETILKRMEDDRGQFIIVAAGYTNEMQMFLDSNPGLSSRFDRIWQFEDYSVDELIAIAELMFASDNLIMNTDAKQALTARLTEMTSTKDSSFGNARSVRKIVDEVKKNQLLRMSNETNLNISKKEIETIKAEDFENLSSAKIEDNKRKKLGF